MTLFSAAQPPALPCHALRAAQDRSAAELDAQRYIHAREQRRLRWRMGSVIAALLVILFLAAMFILQQAGALPWQM